MIRTAGKIFGGRHIAIAWVVAGVVDEPVRLAGLFKLGITQLEIATSHLGQAVAEHLPARECKRFAALLCPRRLGEQLAGPREVRQVSAVQHAAARHTAAALARGRVTACGGACQPLQRQRDRASARGSCVT